MPYKTLDPTDVVVLFADLQSGILERSTTNEPAEVRRGVLALAKLAHLFEIPVIVTAAPDAGGPKITPEIGEALGSFEPLVRKTTDVFTDRGTRLAIENTRRKTLLIAGVATEIIVSHSALSGSAGGYDVQVVVDACGGISQRTEDAAFRRLTQAGVALTSIASVAGQLAGDFTQARGGQALGILYQMAST